MLQTVVVGVLVALAALYSLRHLLRQAHRLIAGLAARKPACHTGCASCHGCSVGAAPPSDASPASAGQRVVLHRRHRA